jgi:SlyX protein
VEERIKSLETQVEDLQTRLVYQEDLLQSLNDVIAKQDSVIVRLEQQNLENQQRIDDALHLFDSRGSEKPPHY